MTGADFLLLFGGGIIAGMINVLAGGGAFMTFPLLIAMGYSDMQAEGANVVALIPANVAGTWVYRKELLQVRKHLLLRLVLAAVGGALGSLLFIDLGAKDFERALPWLLLFTTVAFAAGPTLKNWLEKHQGFNESRWLWLSLTLEFLVFVYGGYFSLSMGILMLAVYSLFSTMTIHQSQALRNATIAVMRIAGILMFSNTGIVPWPAALTIMGGAIVGGYGMAKVARHMPQRLVRNAIICWSVGLTAYTFWHQLA